MEIDACMYFRKSTFMLDQMFMNCLELDVQNSFLTYPAEPFLSCSATTSP